MFFKENFFVIPIFCSLYRQQVSKSYYWQNYQISVALINKIAVGYVLIDVYKT